MLTQDNIEFRGLGNLLYQQNTAYQNQEELEGLRDLFAPHAVRKENAEKALQAVQGEFESLKASYERQINNITQEAQANQANFDRRKSEILAQIEAKKAEKAAAANNAAVAARTTPTAKTTETPTENKGNKGLMIGIGIGAVALTIAGIAYVVSSKKKNKEKK
jgi:ElaB/YqjD/DUF883 family membrane-anchored ribosome-binding protein